MDQFKQELEQAELMRQVLGPFAKAILVNTPQGDFAVSIEDAYVGGKLRVEGAYGAKELERLLTFCHPDTRLLVVGAHIGAFAIPLAKACSSMVAIEANPHNFELLKLNVMLNGLKNARVIHKAASDRRETIDFVLSRVNSGGSKRNPVVREPIYFYDNPEVVKIEAAPLDELFPDEVFDFILMDIEGSECFALKGMQRLLSMAGGLQVEFIPHHLKYVAGVSVEDFVNTISPHFSTLCVETKKLIVERERFLPVLSEMYRQGEVDESLLFLKAKPEDVEFT